MNNKLIKIMCLCVTLVMVFSFAACKGGSQKNAEPSKPANAQSTEPQAADDTKSTSSDADAAAAQGQNNTEPKYADAEIYEKEGKKYAQTESGTEVELSGENLQSMMTDYTKVQGSGSEEEKELLDKIQVILDNAERLQ